MRTSARLLWFSVLSCIAVLSAPAMGATQAFLPPEGTALTYRVTHTEMSQSTDSYTTGELVYTIRLLVLSRSNERTTCSFAIDSLSRSLPSYSAPSNMPAFPGRGTVVFNGSGSVVSATIDEYLIQPSFEEGSAALADGTSDRSIFVETTSFSLPAFADPSLAPGDSIAAPTEPYAPSDNSQHNTHYRLADTTIAMRNASVYGITTSSTQTGTYDQPQYTYRENHSELQEKKLWWSTDLHAAVCYLQTTSRVYLSSVTGQIQQANNMYSESSMRVELLPNSSETTR